MAGVGNFGPCEPRRRSVLVATLVVLSVGLAACNPATISSDDRNDVARLSDAELIAQLSDTAKELGIEINLNYSFYKRHE